MVESSREPYPRSREQYEREHDVLTELRGRLPAHVTPTDAVHAVMCTLSQHLSAGEARDVFAALPDELHPVLERCMLHRGEAATRFGREELHRRVSDHLATSYEQAEVITVEVLRALSAHLSSKEVHDVVSQLPHELRDLWTDRPAPLEEHAIFHVIRERVTLPRGVTAIDVMTTVMRTLAGRLDVREARRLIGALPTGVRPLFDGYLRSRGDDAECFDTDEFFARVAAAIAVDRVEPFVRAVFGAVQRYIRPDESDHVEDELPPGLREIWHAP